jgi:hypothetical protein
MRGVYVDRNITGPNEWTEPLLIEPGQTVAVSAVPVGFAGTVVVQRAVDGTNFWDVQGWEDSGVQGSYDTDVPQFLRIGVPTGFYALGSIYVRLEK